MITIRHTETVNFDAKTLVMEVIAEIDCDAVDELPAPDGLKGYLLHQGSVADIITAGKLAKLAGDGKWYSPTGELIKG